jgi:hypothetical protein
MGFWNVHTARHYIHGSCSVAPPRFRVLLDMSFGPSVWLSWVSVGTWHHGPGAFRHAKKHSSVTLSDEGAEAPNAATQVLPASGLFVLTLAPDADENASA